MFAFHFLPWVVLSLAALLLVLQAAFYRHHTVAVCLAGAGYIGAFVLLLLVDTETATSGHLFAIDGYAVFFMGLLLCAGIFVVVFSYDYLAKRQIPREEFYILLLLGSLGGSVVVASDHFITFFLGLEILTISLYGLIAYCRPLSLPLEAGFKYLILAATASAVLLFGIALIYAQTGTMSFAALARRPDTEFYQPLFLLGHILLMTGLGFKLGVVPFHMWTPDIYEGAPAPVAAFVATVSKGAVLAFLLHYGVRVAGFHGSVFALVIGAIAMASMIAGNLLALMQDRVKRILGYSSIAHLGYLLVGTLVAGATGAEALGFYLMTYFVAILSAFGIIGLISDGDHERDLLAEYRGLYYRRPWISAAFTASILSLASIPLTAGFVGKFYILGAGVQSSLWSLIFAVVLGSAIGIFYYLRIVVTLFSRPEREPRESPSAAPFSLETFGVVALMILLLWLGTFPSPFVELAREAATGLLTP